MLHGQPKASPTPELKSAIVPWRGKWSGRKESNFRRQLGSCRSTIELRLHVACALWHSWRFGPIVLLRVSTNEQIAVDLVGEDIAAPTMLNHPSGVPDAFLRCLDCIEEEHVLAPGQLCSKLLHKFAVGPGFGEGTHIIQIAGAKA